MGVKPQLVVMAAGMASRYGGNKQTEPIDDSGNVILDYSVFDAARTGFGEVIFIIRPELERDFREDILPKMEGKIATRLAFQTHDLPRKKPLGTTHAVLAAADMISGPFAVINADDLYGASAYKTMRDFLATNTEPNTHAMAGYLVENTLSLNGTVKRGVCETRGGELINCVETFGLVPGDGGAVDENGNFYPAGTYISMSCWGFMPSMLDELKRDFEAFMRDELPLAPDTAECLLPETPGRLVREGSARVRVLPVTDKWYGVTYKEDMCGVRDAVRSMIADGVYPADLWGYAAR